MANKEERYRRDTDWGYEGLQRLNRLAGQERRSGAEIARQALVDYEMAQSYFRDVVRGATLQLFQRVVEQEEGRYGDPDLEEPSPADKAMSFLASLLHSPYAAMGIREAFENVLRQNRMNQLEIPSVPLADIHPVNEPQDIDQQGDA
ncbi:hypothetical protein KSF_109740 [Reticulibacter mediterranei]|uniref:Uncharacterized protein n=1 Tax=Reticulibacter mediterranei TaxID=2778369 RepID=A0A8J3J572_9CHLR|nr:hypothetical protein [Reticulibacter mediterranei]GHP00927.1 hypothetical protein KSF_109740 [Reticulibacter mediterranei]